MLRRFSRQTVQGGNEGERSVRTLNSMPLHQVFCQQQIPDSRQDRSEQNADRSFALIEQSFDQRKCTFEVASGKRISEFEDDAGTRKWYQLAHLLDSYP